MVAVEHHPPMEEGRRAIELPIRAVTLLEDRADVRRSGKVVLERGTNRIAIKDVAPVIQDVSMQAVLRPEAPGSAAVADVRVRRAMRILAASKPEAARELEDRAKKLEKRFRVLGEDRRRAEERQERLLEILRRGVAEVPQDAAWGLVNHQAWRDTFETLFKRSRVLRQQSHEKYFEQRDALEEHERVSEARRAIDRPDHSFVAWIEIDINAREPGEAELVLDYVVPNALWRPMHSAALKKEDRLTFTSSAVVWQNTGEDWKDVALSFSTARSSLGTEPPELTEDLLKARKKPDRVAVQVRQVAIQRAAVGGGGGEGGAVPAEGVDLPGVDDGGDTQNLRAPGSCTVPSDGRPNVLPLFRFDSPSTTQLVLIPELVPAVLLKAVQKNEGPSPILAGPVELIQKSGVVGWTQSLFVAPGERFELGFGPDDAVRVRREAQRASEVDPVDRWKVAVTVVRLYLSNLGAEAKRIEITERIPTSEIAHVRVALLADRTTDQPEVTDDGFCVFRVTLPPHGQKRVQLTYSVSSAPDVEGI